ncbi:hypothetical protein [Streptomyces sp. NPDC004014]
MSTAERVDGTSAAGLDEARQRLSRVIDDMRRTWAGRRVIMTVHKFNGGMRALAEELGRSGASLAAVVINTRPAPGDPAAEHVWSCAERGLEMTHRQFEAWLSTRPAELLEWLDEVDPGRDCHMLGTTYAEYAELGGRPAYGHWRKGWEAWEDKTRIDELWRTVGIPAPAHVVCPIDDPALTGTAAALDQGHGVMVAIDTTVDVLGSSQGLRWVRSRGELDAALAQLRGRTEMVRIAAFVPGVPCSAMGMVLPDGVAVFDPIEVITLHRPGTGQLVYCGTSTYWRAGDEQRERLREYARRVGQELADSLGYLGIFSIDGLLGDKEFAATELNPRHVSGLGVRPGWPEFPTRLLNRAVQDGEPEGREVGWKDIEEVYRAEVLRSPSASLWVALPPGAVAVPDGTETTAEVSVTDGSAEVTCQVRYRPQCGGVWIDGVVGDSLPHDGALGPVTAALARALGARDLSSFTEVSAASTLSVS